MSLQYPIVLSILVMIRIGQRKLAQALQSTRASSDVVVAFLLLCLCALFPSKRG